jgi:hypothetical protein
MHDVSFDDRAHDQDELLVPWTALVLGTPGGKGGRHLVARVGVSPSDGEVGSAPPLRRRSGFRSGGVKEARFPPSGRAVI